MGMAEIIKVLEKNEELTSAQICEKTKCSMQSVIKSMNRLLKDTSIKIEVRKLTNKEKEEMYGYNCRGARIQVYSLKKIDK